MPITTPRRIFLARLALGAAGLQALGATAQTPVPLDEADGIAKVLGYRTDNRKVDAAKYPAHKPGQQCGNCHFFQAKAGAAQATCPYFAGKLVAATGWCIAYAPKGEADH
ncbi:MAG: high-potential iron-sulfur protein [Pseudomonadota bacterium]